MSQYNAQRQAIIHEAQTWLNTPWKHNEAVKGVGVDCGQFPLSVYRNCALIGTDAVDDYPIDWALHRDHERYLEIVLRYCVPVDAPRPGDIIVFKFGRSFSHGAISLFYPHIIHALRGEKAGVVFDHALQGDLKRRERKFYSYFVKQGVTRDEVCNPVLNVSTLSGPAKMLRNGLQTHSSAKFYSYFAKQEVTA